MMTVVKLLLTSNRSGLLVMSWTCAYAHEVGIPVTVTIYQTSVPAASVTFCTSSLPPHTKAPSFCGGGRLQFRATTPLPVKVRATTPVVRLMVQGMPFRLLSEPMTPAEPVGPAGPAGPCGPVAPVGPAGPG